VSMPAILPTYEADMGGSWFKGSPANSLQDPISNITGAKMNWRHALALECLLSKGEALSSNSGPTKKKKNCSHLSWLHYLLPSDRSLITCLQND
jgi:hypothetical protein